MFAGRHESLSADAHNAKFSSLVPRVRVNSRVSGRCLGCQMGWYCWFWHTSHPGRLAGTSKSVQPHWSCYQLEDACQCCILVFSFPFDQVCLLLRCFSYITLPLQAALHVAFPAVSVITCLCTILPGSCCAVCRNSHLLACSQI